MKKLLGSSLALVSSPLLAHPGHDHQHWASDWVHLSLALGVFAVATSAAIVIYRKANKES
ncbi:MAG TPA: hypothetical protein DD979_14315 [Gammaproteobacteria bacterium]|jgi:hypothetical protein|nr:hypothetical protein [Gammaproteobacteria bacterium]